MAAQSWPHPNGQMRVCSAWEATGKCPFGELCLFYCPPRDGPLILESDESDYSKPPLAQGVFNFVQVASLPSCNIEVSGKAQTLMRPNTDQILKIRCEKAKLQTTLWKRWGDVDLDQENDFGKVSFNDVWPGKIKTGSKAVPPQTSP